jgi:hypothetical protein
MAEATLEKRISDLEQAVRELRETIMTRRPRADWLEGFIGSMKDEPEFDQVLALGGAIREADRPTESESQ